MCYVALFIRSYHSASLLDEAKRWFEVATVICRFVPGGRDRAERVRLQSAVAHVRPPWVY